MRSQIHFATAVSVVPTVASGRDGLPRPVRALARAVTRPLADGLNLAEHLLAGAGAAAFAVATMHPLDTVKTMVQAAGKQSASSFSTLSTVLRTGGIPALYKGLPVSLGAQIPACSIKFTAFEALTQFASSVLPGHAGNPIVDFACGALAFICCSVVFVPGELLKQRLQAGMYPGLVAGVRTIVKNGGPMALYTGYNATLFRDIPYTMLEFGLYHQFKRALRTLVKKEKLTPKEEIFMGGVAGGCTGFLTTPFDLAKTRLMTQTGTGAARQYKGVVDVLVKVAKTDGIGGLFKGSLARTVWLIPFTAVFFGVHEASKRALLNRRLTKATASKPKDS